MSKSRSYGEICVVERYEDESNGDLAVMTLHSDAVKDQPDFGGTDDALRWIKNEKIVGDFAIVRLVKVLRVTERKEVFVDIEEL